MTKTSDFIQLEKELAPYKSIIEQAVDSVVDQGVSEYPITVVHQQEVEIGLPLFEHKWAVHISSLEEFVSKQLIQPEKIDSFRTIYKNPRKFICLFVLSELGANFIFLPRQKTNNDNS